MIISDLSRLKMRAFTRDERIVINRFVKCIAFKLIDVIQFPYVIP
jgi:hypothetical protein